MAFNGLNFFFLIVLAILYKVVDIKQKKAKADKRRLKRATEQLEATSGAHATGSHLTGNQLEFGIPLA